MPEELQAPLRIQLSKSVGAFGAMGGGTVAILSIAGSVIAYLTSPPPTGIGMFALYTLGGVSLMGYALVGLLELVAGLRRLLRLEFEAVGPEPFEDYKGEVVAGLNEGKLTVFGSLSARLRALFGQNIVSLPPAACRVVTKNGNTLIGRAVALPLYISSIAVLLYHSFGIALTAPLGLLVAASILQGAVEYFASKQLIPPKPSVARAHYGTRHYKGFGHPTHLYSRLPIVAGKLALPGFSNRVYNLN